MCNISKKMNPLQGGFIFLDYKIKSYASKFGSPMRFL